MGSVPKPFRLFSLQDLPYRKQQIIVGLLFITPAMIFLFVFLILPSFLSVRYSFEFYNLLRPQAREFIGLENYTLVLTDPEFHRAFLNTLYFAVVVVPLQTVVALLLALLVNYKTRVSSLFRLGFFSPVITSLTIVSILWTILYATDGLVNGLLQNIGISPQPFLTSKDQAMNSIIAMSIWQTAGYFMMIFLAGLQDIPNELYEAASCDGASSVQKLWYVTLPGLRHVTKFIIIITTIQAFKLFQQPFIMTKGGPQGSTRSLVQYIYEEGIQYRNAGYASATTVVFFLLILLVSQVLKKVLREGETD